MKKITIAIAEDNPLAKKAIIEKLKKYEDIDICIKASNGEELLALYPVAPADVVLMDIEMPVMDGITATAKIREAFPTCKVIMLTTFDDDDKIFNAVLNGASGYLLKDESNENIYKAIIDVVNGGAAMSPAIAFKTLQYVRQQQAGNATAKENKLSAREIEILTELKNGLAYREIAEKLFISEGTIRKHIENIYRKMEVNNKMNAVNLAVKNKWI
jgi:DNA-binding NarL/FixJ family response regulator